MQPSPRNDEFLSGVRERVDSLLAAAGIDPGDVSWHVHWAGPHLTVSYMGPMLDLATRRALSVRVLGAVGEFGRTVGDVDVQFDSAA